ncbi:hypothetical protein QF001_003738 [Paraburkholderia youngii]|uniref:hypothetical protein n=1 Tax=Paraburkholderia youngii TaxID=2782701 RepID=UPI003D1ED881
MLIHQALSLIESLGELRDALAPAGDDPVCIAREDARRYRDALETFVAITGILAGFRKESNREANT